MLATKAINYRQVSVLLPAYNCRCLELVKALSASALMAERESGQVFDYEIIVADDGSTDPKVRETNKAIGNLPNCRYIERGFNSGRSAIRNYLASEASFDNLMFIDADSELVCPDFMLRYIGAEKADIVCGGIEIVENEGLATCNLRYVYERKAEKDHTVEMRQRDPYRCFRTTNFMAARDVVLSHPFDERIIRYGYEDVLFGKSIALSGLSICHIDAPIGVSSFDDNGSFISKIEQSLEILHEFRDELRGYSHLLSLAEKPSLSPARLILRLLFRLFGGKMRQSLIEGRPRLWLFNAYRLGYYLSIRT